MSDAGKGSRDRTSDHEAFRRGHDRTFGNDTPEVDSGSVARIRDNLSRGWVMNCDEFNALVGEALATGRLPSEIVDERKRNRRLAKLQRELIP